MKASDFTIVNGVLQNYTGTDTEIVIPDSVTSIGYGAFYYCESLTNIVIPDSVTSIGKNAFYNCTNFKILCQRGSYAHKYAKCLKIPHKMKLKGYFINK